MEHKLDDEQKEEFKSELEQGLAELKEELDNVFAGWETMKRNAAYAIVGTGVVAFAMGIVVGKSLCQE